MNTPETEEISPKLIKSANLKSLDAYTCTRHTGKPAFCICAKCGAMLCKDCCLVINGRRYCENCTSSDSALCESLERQFMQVKATAMPPVVCEAPQTWTQLPGALLNMLKDSFIFFKTAGKTPFHLSFALAFLALLPNAVITYVFKFDDVIRWLSKSFENTNPDVIGQFRLIAENATTASSVTAAITFTIFKIILLDAIMFVSIHLFTKSDMKFHEAASMLHYCLIPLGLVAIDTWFDMPFIGFLGLGFMIIEASTAIRAATSCTMFQGLFAMLAFIFIATLTGPLAMFP